jgi:hypothetical protein
MNSCVPKRFWVCDLKDSAQGVPDTTVDAACTVDALQTNSRRHSPSIPPCSMYAATNPNNTIITKVGPQSDPCPSRLVLNLLLTPNFLDKHLRRCFAIGQRDCANNWDYITIYNSTVQGGHTREKFNKPLVVNTLGKEVFRSGLTRPCYITCKFNGATRPREVCLVFSLLLLALAHDICRIFVARPLSPTHFYFFPLPTAA